MYKKFVVRILIAVSLLLTASGYAFANEIPDFSNLQGQPVEKGFMGFTVEKPHGTIIARAFANECDGLVVEWGRQNNCSGYQIQCSTSPLYFENTRSVFVLLD